MRKADSRRYLMIYRLMIPSTVEDSEGFWWVGCTPQRVPHAESQLT